VSLTVSVDSSIGLGGVRPEKAQREPLRQGILNFITGFAFHRPRFNPPSDRGEDL
jgi:hypothetical protein